MSTRGAYGFRVDGIDKIAYNQCDSYPEALGEAIVHSVVAWRNQGTPDQLRERVRAVRLIAKGEKPTAEDVKRCARYTNLNVSRKSTDDWYCLLRGAQGDIDAAVECGIILDSADFLKDSTFCEYAYIVNLDELKFEVYKGFQKEPHANGRYGSSEPYERCYPVALVGSFPLSNIPADWAKQCFPDHYETGAA